MRLLLLSGLGPEFLNSNALIGTLLGPDAPKLSQTYERLAGRPVDLSRLRFGGEGGYQLLRPSHGVIPHLPTVTVRNILDEIGIDYDWFDIENLWKETGAEAPRSDYDLVGLSTTFIWDAGTLRKAITWITDRFPAATLILGGQYSNLKFKEILDAYPSVDYVIRGDGEWAIPALIKALEGRGEFSDVPNLAWRNAAGAVQAQPVTYIDLDEHPSPAFRGHHDIVPYESMRGCPFTCKFCSFPMASPKWRYKSAEKIVRDWSEYAGRNGATLIKAMDSTFTVPPPRLKKLLEVLPRAGVQWEAYSRANVLSSREVVQQFEEAHCRFLFVGFESMSETSLENMSKKVSVAQNVRAVEALRDTKIDIRASFLVGYPGETPEEYEKTHRFIVDDFRGRFNINFFMFQDETMPVWQDAPLYDLDVTDGWTWKHCGMDSATAMKLRSRTLFEARWRNERAVQEMWQLWHERPLVPDVDLPTEYRIEKLVERLAYLAKDLGTDDAASARCRGILDELASLGVTQAAEAAVSN